MRVLITGGAGFIGSHLTDDLISKGHEVVVFDNFSPQVHPSRPSYLNPKAEIVDGDVRDKEKLFDVLKEAEAVYHFAGKVGVGQSMYEISNYTDVNVGGTAALLDILVNKETPVKKVVVASSMSLYGEGSYECPKCRGNIHKPRTHEQMKNRDWEMKCSSCNASMNPIPTKEDNLPVPDSLYALTKKFQEDVVLQIGKTYGIPSVAFRFFNVYGTRQALSNPYTGVAAIFMSRIKNNKGPLIFEDGNQLRDFVSVKDICQGCTLALKSKAADYEVFNLGSGKEISILNLAKNLTTLCGSRVTPEITHQFRVGDVRHCFSDISKIKSKLDYEPKVKIKDGLKELIEWSKKEEAQDLVEHMKSQLQSRGLVRG